MDFDVQWTLDDARYIAQDLCEQIRQNEDDPHLKKALWKIGAAYTKSLSVINSCCKKELIEYRMTLVSHDSKESQEIALDKLYTAYKAGMSKGIYHQRFQVVSEFFSKLFRRNKRDQETL